MGNLGDTAASRAVCPVPCSLLYMRLTSRRLPLRDLVRPILVLLGVTALLWPVFPHSGPVTGNSARAAARALPVFCWYFSFRMVGRLFLLGPRPRVFFRIALLA